MGNRADVLNGPKILLLRYQVLVNNFTIPAYLQNLGAVRIGLTICELEGSI